jgi:acetyltransferase-like isoleucine patch superfamily enzyme
MRAYFRRAQIRKQARVGKNFYCGYNTLISLIGASTEQIQIGDNVSLLQAELRCYRKGEIRIGDYSWFSLRTQIISCSSITIGRYCIFARDVYISDTNEHPIDPFVRRKQTILAITQGVEPDRYAATSRAIEIGDDVWVGERACIMKGVKIGNGAVIAANAVVTKEVPEYCVVAGNPAVVVKIIFWINYKKYTRKEILGRNMNIALLSNGFISWGGGIDFLQFCINALINKKDSNDLNLYVLIPRDNQFIHRIKDQLRPLKKMLFDLVEGKIPHYVKLNSMDRQVIIDSFRCFEDKVEILFYDNSEAGLLKVLKQIRADVIIPSITPLGKEFPYPWVGYLYDFQHKYFPEFFTPNEIQHRDSSFSKMLSEARAVIVNAADVKKDILKYYPKTKTQIYSLPFTPIPQKEWFFDENDVVEAYHLPKRYFLISNQFWIHKSHETAFKALAILRDLGINNYEIVCTGNTYDYRFPSYFNELRENIAQLGIENKIKFLGYIPKQDQIQIMRKAIGVLQPTLFEGGPGGGAVYDAVALGVPVILSDIPVNKEMAEDDVVFFKTKSADDLAGKMMKMIEQYETQELQRQDPQLLLEKGKARLDILGDRLLEAINYVIKK